MDWKTKFRGIEEKILFTIEALSLVVLLSIVIKGETTNTFATFIYLLCEINGHN